MDIVLRTIAIFIEVVLLVAILYCLIAGVWLTLFDLGVAAKYKKAVTMGLVMVGCILFVFLIAHLTAFYPGIGVG